MTKKDEKLTDDILIADALIRVKTLENILISKGLFTKEEYHKEMESVVREIAKGILQKYKIPKNLDEFIQELKDKKVDN